MLSTWNGCVSPMITGEEPWKTPQSNQKDQYVFRTTVRKIVRKATGRRKEDLQEGSGFCRKSRKWEPQVRPGLAHTRRVCLGWQMWVMWINGRSILVDQMATLAVSAWWHPSTKFSSFPLLRWSHRLLALNTISALMMLIYISNLYSEF